MSDNTRIQRGIFPSICTIIYLSNVTSFLKNNYHHETIMRRSSIIQGKTQTSDYLELPSSREQDILVLGIDKALKLVRLLLQITSFRIQYNSFLQFSLLTKATKQVFPAVIT